MPSSVAFIAHHVETALLLVGGVHLIVVRTGGVDVGLGPQDLTSTQMNHRSFRQSSRRCWENQASFDTWDAPPPPLLPPSSLPGALFVVHVFSSGADLAQQWLISKLYILPSPLVPTLANVQPLKPTGMFTERSAL